MTHPARIRWRFGQRPAAAKKSNERGPGQGSETMAPKFWEISWLNDVKWDTVNHGMFSGIEWKRRGEREIYIYVCIIVEVQGYNDTTNKNGDLYSPLIFFDSGRCI